MADIKQALTEHLKRSSSVQALAGSRVYPERVPMFAEGPGDFPRVVYRQEGQERPRTMLGSSRQPFTRLTLVCQGYGKGGYADAQALAAAVLDADGGLTPSVRLEDFGGALMGVTDPVWVKGVRFDDVSAEAPEQAPGGEQKPVHSLALAMVVHWNEVSFS